MISPYYATKQAVVGLSEGLFMELQMAKAKVSASVLCPAFVKTKIAESGRNRPGGSGEKSGGSGEFAAMVRSFVENGMAPEAIADRVFEAIRADQFWILTHSEFDAAIRARVDGMLERRNPPRVQGA
jgi:short-subunit dehydrogenase